MVCPYRLVLPYRLALSDRSAERPTDRIRADLTVAYEKELTRPGLSAPHDFSFRSRMCFPSEATTAPNAR